MKKIELKQNPLSGEITFLNIFLVIIKYIKSIFLISFLVCISVTIYVQFFAEIVYTSEAKITSSSSKSTNSQAMNIASQFGINLSSTGTDQNWVFPEIIKSRTLAKKVINKKFISPDNGKLLSLKEIIGSKMGFKTFSDLTSSIMITNKFISMIEISENLKTNIYTLKVNNSNPILSALIADSLITELDMHQRTYNKSQLQQTRIFIQKRILETGNELNKAEDELNTFRTRNRGIQNSPSLKLQEERLSREVNVLTQVFTSLKQQLENSKIDEVRDKEYVIVVDKPEIPIERNKPKKKQLVIMSAIMSFLISCAGFTLFEFLKVTLSKDDILKLKLILEYFNINFKSNI